MVAFQKTTIDSEACDPNDSDIMSHMRMRTLYLSAIFTRKEGDTKLFSIFFMFT